MRFQATVLLFGLVAAGVAACALPFVPTPTGQTPTPRLLSIPQVPLADSPTPAVATPPPLPIIAPVRTATETPAGRTATSTPVAADPQASTATPPVQRLPAPTRPIGLPQARVSYVVDGDTLDVVADGQTLRLRLIGVDTPETVDPRKPVQCFGVEAATRTRVLVEGASVWLEDDLAQGDKDVYGRLLRYVWLADGSLLNLSLVLDGYGIESAFGARYKYQDVFVQAQQLARGALRGLWSPSTCNGDPQAPARTAVPAQPTAAATPAPGLTPAVTSTVTSTPVLFPGAISPTPAPTRTATPQSPGAPPAEPTREPFTTGVSTRVPPAASSAIEIVSITSPVDRGGPAQVLAQTIPGAPCSLKVIYRGAGMEELGVGFKTAESDGRVAWRWTVPTDAPVGIGQAIVTCAGFSKTASITVR